MSSYCFLPRPMYQMQVRIVGQLVRAEHTHARQREESTTYRATSVTADTSVTASKVHAVRSRRSSALESVPIACHRSSPRNVPLGHDVAPRASPLQGPTSSPAQQTYDVAPSSPRRDSPCPQNHGFDHDEEDLENHSDIAPSSIGLPCWGKGKRRLG